MNFRVEDLIITNSILQTLNTIGTINNLDSSNVNTGPTGYTGYTGSIGATGYTGLIGQTGPTGPSNILYNILYITDTVQINPNSNQSLNIKTNFADKLSGYVTLLFKFSSDNIDAYCKIYFIVVNTNVYLYFGESNFTCTNSITIAGYNPDLSSLKILRNDTPFLTIEYNNKNINDGYLTLDLTTNDLVTNYNISFDVVCNQEYSYEILPPPPSGSGRVRIPVDRNRRL